MIEAINPFYLSEKEKAKYFRNFRRISEQDQGTIPYKGSAIFNLFVKTRQIGYGTIIRVANTYIPSIQEHHLLTVEGLQDVSEIVHGPEEMLDPGMTWNIEGFEFISVEQLRLFPRV